MGTWGSWLEGGVIRGLRRGWRPSGSGLARNGIWYDSQPGTLHDLAKLMTWCGPQLGTAPGLAWLTIWHSPWFGMTHGLARLTIWHGRGAGVAHNLAQPRIWPSGVLCAVPRSAISWLKLPWCHRARGAIVPMSPSPGEGVAQLERPHHLHLLPEAGREEANHPLKPLLLPACLQSSCSPGRDERLG